MTEQMAITNMDTAFTGMPELLDEFSVKDRISCGKNGIIHAFLYHSSLRKIAMVPISWKGVCKEISISVDDPRYVQLTAILNKIGKKPSQYFVEKSFNNEMFIFMRVIVWKDVTLDIFRSFLNFKLREIDVPAMNDKDMEKMVRKLKENSIMLESEGERSVARTINTLVRLMEDGKKDEAGDQLALLYRSASGANSYLLPLLDTVKELYINA